MSQRMTMEEVLKEYGVPLIKLDVHATRSELLKLREQLMAIRMSMISTSTSRARAIRSERSTRSPRISSRIGSSSAARAAWQDGRKEAALHIFPFGARQRGMPVASPGAPGAAMVEAVVADACRVASAAGTQGYARGASS